MPIDAVSPSTWDELQHALAEVPSPVGAPTSGQHCVFRGVSDASWSLVHSLHRLGGDLRAKESRVLDDFRHYGTLELASQSIDVNNAWQLMAVAQHHGTPTRLLDWSRHYEVALHFATADGDAMDEVGCVWVVNPHLVHQELPALLKQQLCGSSDAAPGVLRESSVVRVLSSLDALDSQAVAGLTPAFFFEPAWTDQRIKAQNGLFSVVADTSVDIRVVLESIPGCARLVLVDPSLKSEVRTRLDAMGRDERCYFPGLDGVSRFLTRIYLE